MRAIVDLPDDQLLQLQASCKRAGISRAEAVRRAISLYIAQQSPQPDAALSQAFGLFQQHGTASQDGVAYQQALRADWD